MSLQLFLHLIPRKFRIEVAAETFNYGSGQPSRTCLHMKECELLFVDGKVIGELDAREEELCFVCCRHRILRLGLLLSVCLSVAYVYMPVHPFVGLSACDTVVLRSKMITWHGWISRVEANDCFELGDRHSCGQHSKLDAPRVPVINRVDLHQRLTTILQVQRTHHLLYLPLSS